MFILFFRILNNILLLIAKFPRNIKMSDTNVKLSVTENIGYSLGDLSANLIFQTLLTFLAFFCTAVYRIAPGIASAITIIFVGGMIGAFFIPVMGVIADRTQTRWGKFRPWILWTAIPFGIIALLAFSAPDFGAKGKVRYVLITYIILVLVYSANNLQCAALSGVHAANIAERNSVSSYRFVAVMVAHFIVQVLLLPLVLILKNSDKTKGFEVTMGIFASIGVCFLSPKSNQPGFCNTDSAWLFLWPDHTITLGNDCRCC